MTQRFLLGGCWYVFRNASAKHTCCALLCRGCGRFGRASWLFARREFCRAAAQATSEFSDTHDVAGGLLTVRMTSTGALRLCLLPRRAGAHDDDARGVVDKEALSPAVFSRCRYSMPVPACFQCWRRTRHRPPPFRQVLATLPMVAGSLPATERSSRTSGSLRLCRRTPASSLW